MKPEEEIKANFFMEAGRELTSSLARPDARWPPRRGCSLGLSWVVALNAKLDPDFVIYCEPMLSFAPSVQSLM